MRLESITLRNFKGVRERTIVFPDDGVVVLVGPNEVGKTSITNALDLALNYTHDSRHHDVTAAYPIGSSESPYVEVTLSTGQYRLTIVKQWRTGAKSELTIHEPRYEKLVGRDAHDRLRSILEETTDTTLFKALRFFQGEAIKQGSIGDSPSLKAALDASAGGAATDPTAESDLWRRVEAEYLRYFTPTGRVSSDRTTLTDQLGKARTALANATSELNSLEEDGEQLRRLDERITETLTRQEINQRRQTELEEQWRGVQALTNTVETAQTEMRIATVSHERAVEAVTARDELVDAIERAREEAALQLTKADALAPQVTSADEEHARVTAAMIEATTTVTDARSMFDTAQEVADLRRAIVAVNLLSRRKEQADEADRLEREALTVIDSATVNNGLRSILSESLDRQLAATVALNAASARVQVHALSDVEVTLDGVPRRLKADESIEEAVTGTMEVTVPDSVSVRITAGGATNDLTTELADARREVEELVGRYALRPEDPRGHLDELLAELGRAEQDRRHAVDARAAALNDLSKTELEAKLATAMSVVTALYAKGVSEPDSLDTEEADVAVSRAKRLLSAGEQSLKSAASELRAIELAQDQLRKDHHTNAELLVRTRETAERVEALLIDARKARTDEALRETVDNEANALAEKQVTLTEATALLEVADVETLRLTLDNEIALQDRLAREHRQDSDQAIALRATLTTKGSADLQVSIDESGAQVNRLATNHQNVEGRAQAAACLFQTFTRHRDKALASYVVPFQRHVQRLARIVFGSDTEIEVDPTDLTIRTRRVGDEVVPYDLLSTGTREQLGVITRLACAMIVGTGDGDHGVPVILDDALGYTDPDRLRRLGPVFSEAARATQVILMTSTPERYASIGDAHGMTLDH
jgi:uncharacterized protein YhaN